MALSIDSWRLPGCGTECRPAWHDPHRHEAYGLLIALLTPPSRVVRTGGMTIDLDARRVDVDGAEVRLSLREWGYLAYLAEHVGQWCFNEDVLRAAWGEAWVDPLVRTRADGQRFRSDTHLVNMVRCRLRARLGGAGSLIVASRGRSGSRLEWVP